MFPCFGEIVGGVPALERYLTLGEPERLAAAGGIEAPPIRSLVQCQVASLLCALVATCDRYRPARPRPAEPRAVR